MKRTAEAVKNLPLESAATLLPDATALTARQFARRKRIVAAAMDLAARGGYDAVQMRAVAAHAKVALGTLYRYFSSKDQLLAFTWADWSQEIETNLYRHPLRGATSADRIMDFIRRATRALEREPKLASALIKSLLSPDRNAEEPRGRVSAVMARVVDEQLQILAPQDRVGIRDVLGQVWYANLLMWVSGRTPLHDLYANMETACRLLLARLDNGA
jgi:TetR/AcrR family transcriptional regulator, cholesterol catabolism regulator